MNIFGPARIDPNVPVEETVGALKELVEEGRIGAVRWASHQSGELRLSVRLVWLRSSSRCGVRRCSLTGLLLFAKSWISPGLCASGLWILNGPGQETGRYSQGRYSPHVWSFSATGIRVFITPFSFVSCNFCILITSLLRISPRILSWLTRSVSLPNAEVSRLRSLLFHGSAHTPIQLVVV